MQLFSCRRLCNALATLLMCWGSISAVVAADPNPVSPRAAITVFAASSLSDVLREIGAAFTASTGTSLRYSFAASSALARGEAPFGIVYQNDAQAEANVRVIDVFPENTHAQIVYPAAIIANGNADAPALLDFLQSAQSTAIFRKFGFTPL